MKFAFPLKINSSNCCNWLSSRFNSDLFFSHIYIASYVYVLALHSAKHNQYIRIEFQTPRQHIHSIYYTFCFVFANTYQQRFWSIVYWGVKMAYFSAYYFWLISTTSSLRPPSPQHTEYCGENPVFIRVLYAIRVRVVLCYLIDVLHCGQINVHT